MDAYDFKCPQCGAKKGEPCTYVKPRANPRFSNSLQYLDQVARAGKPTQRPHNLRLSKVSEEIGKRARASYEAARKQTHRERDEIIRANASALKAEHESLVRWLRKNAPILWS